jgi:hypothetical protein
VTSTRTHCSGTNPRNEKTKGYLRGPPWKGPQSPVPQKRYCVLKRCVFIEADRSSHLSVLLFMSLLATPGITVQNRESNASRSTSGMNVTERHERQIVKGEENGCT